MFYLWTGLPHSRWSNMSRHIQRSLHTPTQDSLLGVKNSRFARTAQSQRPAGRDRKRRAERNDAHMLFCLMHRLACRRQRVNPAARGDKIAPSSQKKSSATPGLGDPQTRRSSELEQHAGFGIPQSRKLCEVKSCSAKRGARRENKIMITKKTKRMQFLSNRIE